MKLILFFLFSLNLFSSELRTDLLNQINENLPSNYSLEFTDSTKCKLQLTMESSDKFTTWNFDLLAMNYSFDANDFVFQCNEYNFCIDKTTQFINTDRGITKFSQTYYFFSNGITRTEIVPIIDELVENCTPPTEQEIQQSNHNKALAENAKKGWGHTSVH